MASPEVTYERVLWHLDVSERVIILCDILPTLSFDSGLCSQLLHWPKLISNSGRGRETGWQAVQLAVAAHISQPSFLQCPSSQWWGLGEWGRPLNVAASMALSNPPLKTYNSMSHALPARLRLPSPCGSVKTWNKLKTFYKNNNDNIIPLFQGRRSSPRSSAHDRQPSLPASLQAGW